MGIIIDIFCYFFLPNRAYWLPFFKGRCQGFLQSPPKNPESLCFPSPGSRIHKFNNYNFHFNDLQNIWLLEDIISHNRTAILSISKIEKSVSYPSLHVSALCWLLWIWIPDAVVAVKLTKNLSIILNLAFQNALIPD